MDLKKMTDAYENPRKMLSKPDKEAGEKFPEWLTDGCEVRTKNTTYRFADTDNPKVKHVYGGEFTGQEVLLESPIKAGEKLYMTLTSAPQNGRLAGKIIRTSEIQSVQSAVIAENEGKTIGLDSFDDAVNHLNFVNNMQTTL